MYYILLNAPQGMNRKSKYLRGNFAGFACMKNIASHEAPNGMNYCVLDRWKKLLRAESTSDRQYLIQVDSCIIKKLSKNEINAISCDKENLRVFCLARNTSGRSGQRSFVDVISSRKNVRTGLVDERLIYFLSTFTNNAEGERIQRYLFNREKWGLWIVSKIHKYASWL